MRKIDIALQGGGSHGAFTWGVLDRLLEEPDLDITGVSGTSAGAMNAVAVVQGLAESGPERARELLRCYWERVAAAAVFSPLQRTPIDRLLSGWKLDKSPMYAWLDLWSQFLSPYETNPLDINPLREIVQSTFSFETINSRGAIKLFQSATNVKTGRLEIFRQPDIDVETTLASACLPTLYQAVEIEGEAYWDGGYMGNPPLFPLIQETETRDTLIVQINPFRREEVPKSSNDISNRLNEVIFNSNLLGELRSLGFIRNLVQDQEIDIDEYQNGRLHRIAAEDRMQELGVSSKMNASPDFLQFLFKLGHETADRWLATDGKLIGQNSTWHPGLAA